MNDDDHSFFSKIQNMGKFSNILTLPRFFLKIAFYCIFRKQFFKFFQKFTLFFLNFLKFLKFIFFNKKSLMFSRDPLFREKIYPNFPPKMVFIAFLLTIFTKKSEKFSKTAPSAPFFYILPNFKKNPKSQKA